MLIILAGAVNIHSVFATGRVVGNLNVRFIQYKYVHSVTGNDTELLNLIGLTVSESTAWLNISVRGISGTNVTSFQVFYNDTSTSNSAGIFDVETGDIYVTNSSTGFFAFAIAANLVANDLIYNSPDVTDRINETVMAYGSPGVFLSTDARQVNHYVVDGSSANVNTSGIISNEAGKTEYYWDRSSGICLSSENDLNSTRPDGTGGILTLYEQHSATLQSVTPLIPEFPSFVVLPAFMLATLLTVIVYKRRNDPIKPHRTAQ